ncbi:hypothetical protein BU26DRAFT_103046 [Trematosphaeria pertusa]|uniref:Uncharacterized protein n=1 Tax=Trematosphaeria pertusa TaxID=390896 RepID=A0A6A6I1Y6_9PLEO|nr:uncharacterized protein BU26DRAFT_103046 [Trematosphaeria pertusa]KAF2244475.1 hypothetical protein BU26DRAFT_103046 [Trematosphaeria pertusa]
MMGFRSFFWRFLLPPFPFAACATCFALLMAAFLMVSAPFIMASPPQAHWAQRGRRGVLRCGQALGTRRAAGLMGVGEGRRRRGKRREARPAQAAVVALRCDFSIAGDRLRRSSRRAYPSTPGPWL